MRKLSRFGAAALALALSVTFLTPVQALAAKNETRITLRKEKSFMASDEYQISENDLIDKNVTTFERITGQATTDYFDAEENCIDNIILAMAAKGLATTTKPAEGISPSTRTVNGTTYYYSSWNWDDCDSEYKDGVYMYFYTGITVTQYVNTLTGKTSVFWQEVDPNYSTDEAKLNSFQSAIRVKKGEITYLAVPLSGGDTQIKAVKSSKKSVATASAYNKLGSESISNEDNVRIDNVDGGYEVSYKTTVGAKIVVGTYKTYDEAKAAAINVETTTSGATRYIKIDAKKPGKTNLTFNIINKNGNVSKVKTTIHVVDSISVFKTLSFGGQSLLFDNDETNNLYVSSGDLYLYTTKAKGKFVAKTNKNYVIKSIEMGTLYTENYNMGISGKDREGKDYDYSDIYSSYSSSGKYTTHRVDLNGDGDFDDIINGINESYVYYKYKKIKSGKTVKLGTVGDNQNSSLSYTYKDLKNRKGELRSYSRNVKTRNFVAPTSFRITIYDKITKSYDRVEVTVSHPVKK